MIANTGGDRLIDWGGEFNSYLVPFDPFGMPTISRNPSPQLAGPALRVREERRRRPAPRSASTRSDPTRNGEPFGELGARPARRTRRGATSTAARATRSPATSTAIATSTARRTCCRSAPARTSRRPRSTRRVPIRSSSIRQSRPPPLVGLAGIATAPDHLLGWGGRDRRIHDQRRRRTRSAARRRSAATGTSRSRVDLSTPDRRHADGHRDRDRRLRERRDVSDRDADEGHDAAGRADARPLGSNRHRHARRLDHEQQQPGVRRQRRAWRSRTGLRQRRPLHRRNARQRHLHGHRDPDRRRRQRLGRDRAFAADQRRQHTVCHASR